MSDLREHAEEYLAARRALGHKLADHGHLLLSFISHLEAAGAERITLELAIEWAMLPRNVPACLVVGASECGPVLRQAPHRHRSPNGDPTSWHAERPPGQDSALPVLGR